MIPEGYLGAADFILIESNLKQAFLIMFNEFK